MTKNVLRVAPVIFGTVLMPLPGRAADMLVFFGTHRSGPHIGFSMAHFDAATGKLTPPQFLRESDAPSFFVIHPDRIHLYACNSIDTYQGKPEGTLSAYAIEPGTGKLTELNRVPSGGAEPCFISLDRTGRHALAANYNGGSICVYAIQSDGRLGPRTALVRHSGGSVNPQRQSAPHPHSITVDPSNHFALVPDLGADKVFLYRFNAQDGSLAPGNPPWVSVKPGSGPRHLAFHPNGRLAYVISELSSTITAFDWDSTNGLLKEIQTISTLPPGFKGANTAAEVKLHPNGRFLYASNRGCDDIAVFAVDPESGRLAPIGHVPSRGKMPRNFSIDPSGRWMLAANHDSDNAVLFRVDDGTGMLAEAGAPVPVPNPFCIGFLAEP